MEWVDGERLDSFIEQNLNNSSVLLSLALRWVEMVKALRNASIAHGDLQHGNVLVVKDEFKLVDYDGMYVPALSGKGSHEVGHRNYQHPLRTEADFGPYVDNFSAWVVYVSLIALAVDPSLWQRFSGGDECLLFRRRDFEQPEASDVLRSLERHSDERIRSAVTLFKSLLYRGPRDVPSLDGQIPPPTLQPAAVSFRNSATLERVVLVLSAILIPLPFWTVAARVLFVILLNVSLWVYRYCSDDRVREREVLESRLREIQSRIRSEEGVIVTNYLRQFSLDRATIPGIGPTFKGRLIASGFCTAADIDFYKVQGVHGIGPTRADALVNWRNSLEVQAKMTAEARKRVASLRLEEEELRRRLGLYVGIRFAKYVERIFFGARAA
jgi:hypothetical protein